MESVDVKLARAGEHLDAIQAAVDRWAERDPCDLIMDCDAKTREHHFRLRVFEPPPANELNILISECVHNLRTSLDHMAYGLATYIRGGSPPANANNTGFPLARTAAEFRKFNAMLGGMIGSPKRVPPALRAALEAAQPCKGGDAANLAILEDLNNCDKHRFPPLLAAVGRVTSMHIGTVTGAFQGPYMGPLEDGAIVARFTPAPNTEVDMELRVAFDVAFGDGYPGHSAHVVGFLLPTLDYMRGTLAPSLAPFL